MGLDMYLKARLYLPGWNHYSAEVRKLYDDVIAAAGLGDFRCAAAPSGDLSINVCYWRNANAIHKWFVDNCQDGKDECQVSGVSREQLIELRDLCLKVLDTRNPSLLPPEDGFFFGSTDTQENSWYWHDVEDTVKCLTKLLDDERFNNWDFAYRSSW